MNKRGFTLTVILILAAAMFSTVLQPTTTGNYVSPFTNNLFESKQLLKHSRKIIN